MFECTQWWHCIDNIVVKDSPHEFFYKVWGAKPPDGFDASKCVYCILMLIEIVAFVSLAVYVVVIWCCYLCSFDSIHTVRRFITSAELALSR